MKKPKRKHRDYITAEELLGKVRIPKHQDPAFINDGSGNGWFVYPCGTISYCYVR